MDEDAFHRSIQDRIDREIGPLKARRKAPWAPPAIFHYTTLDALLSIVSSGSMRATNCMYLNDAAEVKATRALLHQELCATSADEPTVRYVCGVFDELLQLIGPSIFVLSFSLEPDSLSLWNGYGFESSCAIGFDWRKLFRRLSPTLPEKPPRVPCAPLPPQAFPVLYDRDLQTEVVRAYNPILLHCRDTATELSLPQEVLQRMIANALMDLLIFAIGCKTAAHEYEREYRIAFSLTTEELSKVKYRVRRDVVVPYIDVPMCAAGELLPLSEVRIGPRNRSDMACDGVRAYLRSQGYTDVATIKSDLDIRF